jgi:hypothetical protein
MAFNVLELHWKIAAITTITTNSYNMSDFELQVLQQYSYNISDLELLAVSYNSRQVVLQPNPSAATTFQAISYNSRKVGGGGVLTSRAIDLHRPSCSSSGMGPGEWESGSPVVRGIDPCTAQIGS